MSLWSKIMGWFRPKKEILPSIDPRSILDHVSEHERRRHHAMDQVFASGLNLELAKRELEFLNQEIAVRTRNYGDSPTYPNDRVSGGNNPAADPGNS